MHEQLGDTCLYQILFDNPSVTQGCGNWGCWCSPSPVETMTTFYKGLDSRRMQENRQQPAQIWLEHNIITDFMNWELTCENSRELQTKLSQIELSGSFLLHNSNQGLLGKNGEPPLTKCSNLAEALIEVTHQTESSWFNLTRCHHWAVWQISESSEGYTKQFTFGIELDWIKFKPPSLVDREGVITIS